MKLFTCVWRVALAVLIGAAVLSCDNGLQGGGSSGGNVNTPAGGGGGSGGSGSGGSGSGGSSGGGRPYTPPSPVFVAVSGITGVPATAYLGTDRPLGGTVTPANATNRIISWEVTEDENGTNVTIEDGILKTSLLSVSIEGPEYPAIITVKATIANGRAPAAAYTAEFTIEIRDQPQYGIELDHGSHDFGTVVADHYDDDDIEEKTVTITNIGGEATGELTLTLEGDGAERFEISSSTIDSVDPAGNAEFTIAPQPNLEAGAYAATVVVSNTDNGISETFEVSFEVEETTYSISLTKDTVDLTADGHTFSAGTYGYNGTWVNSNATLTVTVSNTGNVPTGELTVELDENGAESFVLSADTLTSIDPSGSRTFTVKPKTGLGVSQTPYTATVTVSGSHSISATFTVSFTVNKANRSGPSITVTGVSASGITYTLNSSYPPEATYDVYYKQGNNALPGDTSDNGFTTTAGWTKVSGGVSADTGKTIGSALLTLDPGGYGYTLAAAARGSGNYNDGVSAAVRAKYCALIDLAEESPAAIGFGWTYGSNVYTITGDNVFVTGNTAIRSVKVQNSVAIGVTLRNAHINGTTAESPFDLSASGAEVTVNLEGSNTLRSTTTYKAGLRVPENKSLVITATETGPSLTVWGGGKAAGIGDARENSGDITINGHASVTATGGLEAAGIGVGEGSGSLYGTVTISGHASVTATGGGNGAGIGFGKGGNRFHGTLHIKDNANVTAGGEGNGAGIGGGEGGNLNGTVNITGGTVTARSSTIGYDHGAGIGGGSGGGLTGTVNITGGTVTARSINQRAIGPGWGNSTSGTQNVTGTYTWQYSTNFDGSNAQDGTPNNYVYNTNYKWVKIMY